MRRRSTALASALLAFTALHPAFVAAQEPAVPHEPGGSQSQCTTTWTVTTKCTGDAAPLALPGNAPPQQFQVQPLPPPNVYAPPPPAYGYPPPGYGYPPPAMLPQAWDPEHPPIALRPSHTEMRPRYGLMIAGLSVFGGMYLWNALFAYSLQEGKLAVPVIGPLFYWSGERGYEGFNALLVIDTLAQASGVVMFVAGLVTKKKVTVYDKGDTHISLLPTASSGGAGLSLGGTF